MCLLGCWNKSFRTLLITLRKYKKLQNLKSFKESNKIQNVKETTKRVKCHEWDIQHFHTFTHRQPFILFNVHSSKYNIHIYTTYTGPSWLSLMLTVIPCYFYVTQWLCNGAQPVKFHYIIFHYLFITAMLYSLINHTTGSPQGQLFSNCGYRETPQPGLSTIYMNMHFCTLWLQGYQPFLWHWYLEIQIWLIHYLPGTVTLMISTLS